MRGLGHRWFVAVIVFGVALLLGSAAGAVAPAQEQDSARSKDECLECHGPFEKLVSAPPRFETRKGGDKVNPHQFVALGVGDKVNPHRDAARDSTSIPDCAVCHQPHPVPLASKEGLQKPRVEWCYDTCHHVRDFTPCSKCHGLRQT